MKKGLITLVLAVVAAIAVSPVCFLLAGMLMDNQELTECLAPVFSDGEGFVRWHIIPRYPTLQNLVELLLDAPEFFQMFWNSVKITVCILGGQLVFGMTAAWGLARYQFRGKKVVYMLFIVLMMMPFQVTMLSEYLVLDSLRLMDTLSAVILPGIFSTFPVFIMYRFFCSIPKSIIEAARIDGAGEFRIFLSMGLPLGSAGILSSLVLSFLECWNMIERPMLFLKSKELWPLSLFLPQIKAGRAGFAFCASLMAVLPAIFVFLSGQDYLEQGIASAAAKE